MNLGILIISFYLIDVKIELVWISVIIIFLFTMIRNNDLYCQTKYP